VAPDCIIFCIDWTLFAAASTPDLPTREKLIKLLHRRAFGEANLNATIHRPFATTYSLETGENLGGAASAAQGGMFALIDTPYVSSRSTANVGLTQDDRWETGKGNRGAIAGGVVGGLGALLLLGLIMFCVMRQKKDVHWKKVPSRY